MSSKLNRLDGQALPIRFNKPAIIEVFLTLYSMCVVQAITITDLLQISKLNSVINSSALNPTILSNELNSLDNKIITRTDTDTIYPILTEFYKCAYPRAAATASKTHINNETLYVPGVSA